MAVTSAGSRDSRRSHRLWSRLAALALLTIAPGCSGLEAELETIIEAAPHLQDRHLAPHRVAILSTGREALLLRLRCIRAAQRSVRIQTFIFVDSKTTRLVIHELVRAARRGVKVQILADTMFSETDAIRCARAAVADRNIEMRAFNPVTTSLAAEAVEKLWAAGTGMRRINRRMHNKVMIVDDRLGICGGRNYDDSYYDEGLALVYRDRDVAVEGPVVTDMVRSFADYWESPASVPLIEFPDVESCIAALPPEERGWPFSTEELEISGLADRTEALLRQGEPKLRWHDVSQIAFWADPVEKTEPTWVKEKASIVPKLIAALGSARQTLLIQSPYMVLSDTALELFGLMDRVSIRIHTNSLASTDAWASYAHVLRQRVETIKSLGLDVREAKPYPEYVEMMVPGYRELCARARSRSDAKQTRRPSDPFLCLHAKSMVVDDGLALIGSYNLDPRSANLNSEVVVAIWDRGLAGTLARQIETDCRSENSWVLAPKKRAFGTRTVLDLLERVNEAVKRTSTFDVWPVRSCSLFDLKPGAVEVSRFDPRFHDRYVDVGQFPEVSNTREEVLHMLARSLTGVFRDQM